MYLLRKYKILFQKYECYEPEATNECATGRATDSGWAQSLVMRRLWATLPRKPLRLLGPGASADLPSAACWSTHLRYPYSRISYISYPHIRISYSHILYLIAGGVWGGDCCVHKQIRLNSAVSSSCHTILAILYYNYLLTDLLAY